jgi:biotin carboxyl carrier protein
LTPSQEVRVAEIRAEMVANVWKVVAAEGDSDRRRHAGHSGGQMKMEIPVLAEGSGTISRMAVAEGDVIQEGDLIAVIE